MKARGIVVTLLVLLGLFVFGVIRLFLLGADFGNVYPPYSSHRSDPLGVRAFVHALDSLPTVLVERNLEPIVELGDGEGMTLFVCGAALSKDPEEVVAALEAFAASGGRLVITFFPVKDDFRDQPKESEENGKEDETRKAPEEPWRSKLVSIEDRWGFSYGFSPLPTSTEDEYGETTATRQVEGSNLPRSLSWHSGLFFDNLDEHWQTIYTVAGDRLVSTKTLLGKVKALTPANYPVLIERRWGKGRIVLSGDSYFLSNEAMRMERHPELLAWLVGDSSAVLFDETHFGIERRPGVMTLMREYRLSGFLGVLIVVAGLFVWKNAVSLAPKRESVSVDALPSTLGRDSTAGLINLLRRSISSRRILSVCAEEWERSQSKGGRIISEDQKARVLAIVESAQASRGRKVDPVKSYRYICEVLTEGK